MKNPPERKLIIKDTTGIPYPVLMTFVASALVKWDADKREPGKSMHYGYDFVRYPYGFDWLHVYLKVNQKSISITVHAERSQEK